MRLPWISILPPVVAESTATNRIYDDEEDKENNVDNSHFLPVTLEVLQKPSFARSAVIAQGTRIVAPDITVTVAVSDVSILAPVGWAYIYELAVFGGLTATRLNRRQVFGKEFIRTSVSFLGKFLANFAINQTTPNTIPVLRVINSFLQPVRVITQLILLIPTITHNFPGTFVGDNEGEDSEAEEYKYEQEHDDEVDPQQPIDAATGADEACEGDDQEEDAECYDGLFEVFFAVGGGFVCEPDAATEDGDGEEEGDEVQDAYQTV